MASSVAVQSISVASFATTASAKASVASKSVAVTPVRSFSGLKQNTLFSTSASQWESKTVSNGARTQAMKVWTPLNNKKFETLSYLPPLSSQAIAKEIEYLIAKGWTPCIEFDEVGYVSRDNFQGCGYYDGRYWTMWKLPLFGCSDPSQVLREIAEAKNEYPNAFIRVLGFDAKRQVQCSGFLVQRPGQSNF